MRVRPVLLAVILMAATEATASIQVPVRAVHIAELRSAVRGLE